MKLSELIHQERFASTAQETILNVIVTSSWLTRELTAAMSAYGITLAQYNALRILRGSYPEALTCSEVGSRLLDRTPDVTRLLNRLERADLIARARAEHDRRVVEVLITQKGLDLLERMQETVDATSDRLIRHLSEAERRRLCDLLEQFRTDQQD